MYIASARVQFKINTHRCWNWPVHSRRVVSCPVQARPCHWNFFFLTQFEWHHANVLDNWQLAEFPQSGGRECDPRRVHDDSSVPLWVDMRFPVPEHQNQTKQICISPAQGRISKLTHTSVEIDTSAFQMGCQLSVIGNEFCDTIWVAWSERDGQQAASGVASVWRSWVRSPPGPRLFIDSYVGWYAFPCARASKSNQTNMYIASARAHFKINTHKCWNWHLCIPDGLSVVRHWKCVLWHNLSGMKRTWWTTGSWRSCLSLEVVSSIPAWSTIIYRFLCGFICVFLCQSIKIKPKKYVCMYACMYV